MGALGRGLFKLYVRNLPWTIGHSELKAYFNKFGAVSGANVIFDKDTGLSRNYGFVFYKNKQDYDSALQANDHFLEGNKLRVYTANVNTE